MVKMASTEIVKDFVDEIIKKIGLQAETKVKEADQTIEVSIKGENMGALIGYHGETLESLQLILSLMLNKKENGEWKRIVVDIGNWRSERQEALKEMIGRAVSELKNSQLEQVALPAMSSSQRRLAHLIVSEDFPEIVSQSEGEEPNRRVILRKS
jgi:spoIIIJ-associated protein